MATFIDKRPAKKPPKLTAEEKRHEEIKAARKNAIKVASQALIDEMERRADIGENGELSPIRINLPPKLTSIRGNLELSRIRETFTVDDFPTQEDFNS